MSGPIRVLVVSACPSSLSADTAFACTFSLLSIHTHNATLHHTRLYYTALHYTTLHYTTLPYTARHRLHYIALQSHVVYLCASSFVPRRGLTLFQLTRVPASVQQRVYLATFKVDSFSVVTFSLNTSLADVFANSSLRNVFRMSSLTNVFCPPFVQ